MSQSAPSTTRTRVRRVRQVRAWWLSVAAVAGLLAGTLIGAAGQHQYLRSLPPPPTEPRLLDEIDELRAENEMLWLAVEILDAPAP